MPGSPTRSRDLLVYSADPDRAPRLEREIRSFVPCARVVTTHDELGSLLHAAPSAGVGSLVIDALDTSSPAFADLVALIQTAPGAIREAAIVLSALPLAALPLLLALDACPCDVIVTPWAEDEQLRAFLALPPCAHPSARGASRASRRSAVARSLDCAG